MQRPDWWTWEIAFIGHLESRMEERGFNEVDLRSMLENATDIEPARKPGRWLVQSRLREIPWLIVVEPDPEEKVVVVVTAYPRQRR